METNTMDMEKTEEGRKQVLQRLFYTFGLFISVVLGAFFMYARFFDLLVFTAAGFGLFLLAFFLLARRMYVAALHLGVLAIVANTLIDSYFLGWACYFWLNLISMALLFINAYSIGMKWKIAEVVFVSILFFVLLFLTMDGFRVYEIAPGVRDTLRIFNILSVVSTLFFMQFYNFRENELLKKRFEHLSEIDMLTGAHNRRFFNKYLEIEIKRLVSQLKYGRGGEIDFGIAMLDVDNFKRINDECGHLAGDAVLAETARLIRSILFERDVFCRYGGEEFVVLFTSTGRTGAMIAVEKIRRAVEEHPFVVEKMPRPERITVSIGFASFEEESDLYRLLDLADSRMYEAKRRGKNTVVGG
jgi:diguanylate cyclase (GGDEF)-like protein